MNNTNNNYDEDDYDYDNDVDFADHDLDDLPADALQHLEASAIRATQHAPAHSVPPGSDYGGGFDDGEEVINLDDEHNTNNNNNNNNNNNSGNHNHHVTATNNNSSNAAPTTTTTTTTTNLAPTASQADAGQLLVRIKKLEQEQARNKKQAHDLRVQLQTKAGEADTLRRRHDAEARRYERQLADQQLYHADQLAQLRLDMEKLRREKDQAHTANLFDQHDAREAGMAHRTRSAAMPSRPKSTTAAALSPATTPKRAQRSRALLGDGFDDQDVVMVSPSRSRDRLKMATPRQLAKRKRQAVDQSPIPLPALQLSEPRNKLVETSTENPSASAAIDATLFRLVQHDDGRFSLLHRLLSQPSMTGTDRMLEALTQYAFPSQPVKKISSLLYDALSDVPPADAHSLALRFCDVFLNLWKRCLDERYYAPVFLILNAVNFILTCEPAKTAIETAERIVPLITASVDLVALPIANAAKLGGEAVNSLYSTNQRTIASQINVVDCLQLLYLIATSCTSFTDQTDTTRLWKMIPSSFAIMLLNKEFPRTQIVLMLKILGTSALATTIGPVAMEEESQANVEDALINRLTNIFNETPRSMTGLAETSTPVSESTLESDILDLRLLVLMVLTKFSVSQHGSARLAENRICIGRLIKYLDISITSLYLHPLSSTQAQKVESINATMKLIFHITTSNPGFDIKTKLANTLGGQHAYLVALTRLAFSEGLVLEAGIEDAVVDMAHSILDEGLSPQEGDAFGMVFSSGNSI